MVASEVEELLSYCRVAAKRIRYVPRSHNFDKQILNLPLDLLKRIDRICDNLKLMQPPIYFELRGLFNDPATPVLGRNSSIRELEPFSVQPWAITEELRFCSPFGMGESATLLHQSDSGVIHLGMAFVLSDEGITETCTPEGKSQNVCVADFMTGYNAYRWKHRVGLTDRDNQPTNKLLNQIKSVKESLDCWTDCGPILRNRLREVRKDERALITGTTHVLPVEKLSPKEFERLCLWLVFREGFEQPEHYGDSGNDQGRDLIAKRAETTVVFQCKRVRRFSKAHVAAELEKLKEIAVPPAEVIFIVTCRVSATTRSEAEELFSDSKVSFWAITELDERIKRHPEVVREFFQV